MNENLNTRYCQSCGMPLRFDIEEYLGTNADKTRSNEYCYYCLKDGEYTVDITMTEMINIWVKYTEKYNDYSATAYTPDELRIILQKRLPTLKRFTQQLTTQSVHNEVVNKIKLHIDRNLNKLTNLEELCEIANLSFFHLRRVFKSITGENLGSYIQRLRLEYVAHKLIFTTLPINEIQKETNYQTVPSLAKAFKKHYGISMVTYRKRFRLRVVNNFCAVSYTPEIKKINTQNVICCPVYNGKYFDAWDKIITYRNEFFAKEEKQFISISLDEPLITSTVQCRFYVGLLACNEIEKNSGFCNMAIPGGLYAVFRYKGNYVSLPELYQYVYEVWFPQSIYVRQNSMSFEVYVNSPVKAAVNELITDVYIPIKKK